MTSGEARESGRERVDADLDRLDRHAAEARRSLVRTDREDVPAEARVAQDAHGENGHQRERPDSRREEHPASIVRQDAEQRVEPLRVGVDLLLVREPLGGTAQDRHRAERDDERRDAKEAYRAADQETREGGHGDAGERGGPADPRRRSACAR